MPLGVAAREAGAHGAVGREEIDAGRAQRIDHEAQPGMAVGVGQVDDGIPGAIPAMNSLPMETSVIMP